ncbi:hypothetical protein CYQ88_04240 [Hydrogenovibrio sp. SC-1]|uniref:DUF2202 domain-containing protein n=1 Tax=Hydrogenovibrio sp. SC-1 TaxID=2065820 RepID=UPI000C7AE045|nr:DUF2202 domain-containing protein [Hydrogenovibrio sp. SC-1]PLA74806.1 hypothetical protein CYQ88_04240 [Hydrogenovibrio sp. SC-1]
MFSNPSKHLGMPTIISLALLTACTNPNSSSSSLDISTTDIVAERGPLLNAVLQDATGSRAEAIGQGVYRFSGEIQYPIETTGGIIDLNRNSIIDEGDLKTNGIKLKANSGKVVTIATTLAGNEVLKQKLISDLNLSEDTIFSQTPSSDKAIAALSDEVFKYCIENNITDAATIAEAQWETILIPIQNRIDRYTLSPQPASELEQDLVTNELSGQVLPLLPSDADYLNGITSQGTSLDTTLASLPNYALDNTQKRSLAYLWNEEKMAKDLYLALNQIYPSNTLNNIANNAESQHQLTMESLLQKYNIDIEHYDDENYSYTQSVLDNYAAGNYALSDIQSLYDSLYATGISSAQASLEVGCQVEVTDIDDLTQQIEIAGDAQDLKMVFENLRRGSYNHYWAFDNALKKQGVTDGCCSLGTDFCHPEYPIQKNDQPTIRSGNGKGKH